MDLDLDSDSMHFWLLLRRGKSARTHDRVDTMLYLSSPQDGLMVCLPKLLLRFALPRIAS